MTYQFGSVRKCGKETGTATLPDSGVQSYPDVQALNSAKEILDASAADLAKWCGVHSRTMERWLAGDTLPQLSKLVRSRRLYPVFAEELDKLMRGEKDHRPAAA